MWKIKNKEEINTWEFIIQANNENEANVIESILNSESIPVEKKYREAGGYLMIYMGMTNFGVDIYVPADLVLKAQEVLNLTETDEPENLSE